MRFSRSISSTDTIYQAKAPTGSPSAPRSAFRCRVANPRTSAPGICDRAHTGCGRSGIAKVAAGTQAEVSEINGQGGDALAGFVKIEKGLGPEGRIAVV